MRKSVRIFGRAVPLWLIAVVLAAILGVAIAAYIIGTITMPWEIVPPPPTPTATMTPSEFTLEIGKLYFGETKTVAPRDVADLIVENGAVDITVSLDGDYSGFTALTITIQLRQDGNIIHEAVIEPVIVVSDTLNLGPTGWGGWSDRTASQAGEVVTCFVRNVGSGEGDYAQLIRWVPGASADTDGDGSPDVFYPETPFGYVYQEGETGYIMQNDNDHDSFQLILVYPQISIIIQVQPGVYDVYVGYSVTAGNVECAGAATLNVSYDY